MERRTGLPRSAQSVRALQSGLPCNAALIGHPRLPLLSRRAFRENPTTDRLFRLVARATPALPEPLREPRMLLVTGLVFHGIADNARLARRRGAASAWDLYVSHLVDCVIALLRAPVSAPTEAALGEGSRTAG